MALKGWARPGNAQKWHYFNDDIVSVCRKWMFAGEMDEGQDDHPDNCIQCQRKKKRQDETQKTKAHKPSSSQQEALKKLKDGGLIEVRKHAGYLYHETDDIRFAYMRLASGKYAHRQFRLATFDAMLKHGWIELDKTEMGKTNPYRTDEYYRITQAGLDALELAV